MNRIVNFFKGIGHRLGQALGFVASHITDAQLTAAIIETAAHYFRGIQRSEIEAAIHAAYRLATLVLAVMVLAWWPRLDFLGAAMLIPAVVAMLTSIGIAWRLSTGNREPGTGNQQGLLTPARFFREVLPLGAGVLLSAFYFRIDVYFIEQWQGLEAVGGYNAVFRLVEAMRLLPAAVILKHALRNAILPIVSLFAVTFGFLLGGSVIVESVFALDGIGLLAFQSIVRADFPVVQAIIVFVSFAYIGLTLLADVINAWLDPRIRLG